MIRPPPQLKLVTGAGQVSMGTGLSLPPPPSRSQNIVNTVLGPVTNTYRAAQIAASQKRSKLGSLSSAALYHTSNIAKKAAKVLINKSEIIRAPGKHGKLGPIVSPVKEYLWSSFENFKNTPNRWTALKYLGMGALLFGIYYSKIFTTPDLAVHYVDQAFDSVVHFTSFLTNLIPSVDIVANLHPKTDRIFDLTINNQEIFRGLDFKKASNFMLGTILLIGNGLMMRAYRQPAEADPKGKNRPIRWSRALLFQSAIFASTLLYQTLSDNAGIFQYTEHLNANNFFWDHWLNWDWQAPNMARLSAYWGAFGVMSQIWSDLAGFGIAASNVLHTKISDGIHSLYEKYHKRMPLINATLGILNGVLGVMGAYNMSMGAGITSQHSFNFIITAYNLFISYILLSSVNKPQNLLKFFKRVPSETVTDEVSGKEITIPSHARVKEVIRDIDNQEREAIGKGIQNPHFSKAGRYGANIAAGLFATSVMALGGVGAYDLITNQSHMPFVTDNPVIDATAALAGLGTGAALLTGLIRPNGAIRRWLGAARTTLATLFKPSRFGYWFGAFFMVATTTNFALNLTSQALQGYDIFDWHFIGILFLSSVFGPAWVNRLAFGTYTAVTRNLTSKYAMFLAGFLTLTGCFAAHIKTPPNNQSILPSRCGPLFTHPGRGRKGRHKRNLRSKKRPA